MTTLNLEPSDFTTIESFELRWRWTQATHAILPPHVLASIRPLRPEAAARFGRLAADLCREDVPHEGTRALETEHMPPDDVRVWLRGLPISSDELLLVSWADDIAVQTHWATFVDYWDDFCYSSSDDVTVCPLSSGWVLCYWHYERLEFRPGAAA